MLNRRRGVAGTLAVMLAIVVVAGCGGSNDSGSFEKPPPAGSLFPATGGKPLLEVLSQATPAGDSGPVVSPAGMVFHKGENRVPFGVFTLDRKQIRDAEVALYAAPGAKGKTIGPFPARIEDLRTESRFRAQTTSGDPDAAQVAYSAEVPFDKDGEWRLGAIIRNGDDLRSTLLPSVIVGQYPKVPGVGDKAPKIHTPTAESVGGDLTKIDTRVPPDDMHETDFADVVGKKPVVLTFATPQLCQSRVCGPIVDEALQLEQRYGDKAEFIHMEVYNDNVAEKGLRPQMKAYNLPTEPWVFVIDSNGVIRSRFEGAVGVAELGKAVQAAIVG